MSGNDTENNDKKPEAQSDDFAAFGKATVLRPGLYIVATPIGNLRDISLRALDTLRAVDLVACEDTRVTRKLFSAYQIRARLESYNDHSDTARRERIVELLQEGKTVALVSDAGMPLISDPGYKLVRACQERGIYITTISGANAPLSAVQLSGLPSDKFCFLGFLPSKEKHRGDVLKEWASVKATLVAFETAPRLIASLRDILKFLGDREVAVVRELSKMFEEVRRGNCAQLIAHYEHEGEPRGEIVLVMSGAPEEHIGEETLRDMVRDALQTMRTKEAAAFVAEKTGEKKSRLYEIALEITGEGKS